MGSTRYGESNGRLDDEKDSAFVPTANPADTPAINVIADGDFSEKWQKLSLNLLWRPMHGFHEKAQSSQDAVAAFLFGTVPGSLEDDRNAVGGPAVASKLDYTCRMKAMKPLVKGPGGSVRVVDSNNFPAAKTIASALFTIKPGALRELHWHPKSEWQYYLGGSARMTVFASAGQAHTMDYKANDVGYVPAVAGHYLQNTGNDDMSFLALFKSSEFVEFSLDQWLRRLPVQMTQQHLRLSPTAIARIPLTKNNIFRQ
jgi:oxalate decarboxylase